MSENLQEYSLIALGLLLTIIPILKEVRSKVKSNGKIFYICLIVAISVSLFYLGFKKVRRDKSNSTITEKNIDKLIIQVNQISILKKSDSLTFKEFQKNLLEKFQITRDSSTNKPIKVFNTSIKNAETVNIGQN